MNHLLRTLTESQVKRTGDLRLLLTTVKDGRRPTHDAKITDPFYDSLEGLLTDLKSITIDNRDAEAFLKPVSKAEVPDYYDVIQNPMDFQTMLKKVKQKQYKSKREFKDDLDLIWSNCLTYNAAENHPLRPCVKRLKLKAERLLTYITDRKERTDPPIPSDLPSTGVARPRMNGINGHRRSPSITTPLARTTVKNSRDIPFQDTPAILRTPEGMISFIELDKEASAVNPKSSLAQTLRNIAPDYESDSDVDGLKRKSNGLDQRPRKKARFEDENLPELWWGAMQADEMIANGLPSIPFGPSSSKHKTTRKLKRLKRNPEPPPHNPKSLLSMMNANITTMRRLRHTHAKFTSLNAATAPPEDEEQGAEGGLYGTNNATGPRAAVILPPSFGIADDDVVNDKIDESSWILGKGKRKSKLSGIEIGAENAADCLHWTMNKILEHAGFQGSSSVALDVLADVTSEYLLNVGRTIKFLTDKHGKTMTTEEIILHTLFESGSSKIQDIERYISDDIQRYGARLGELEKKLVGAYRETAAGEVLEDEGLFEEEEEDETGALAIGEFADLLGEDYLGLRELGIAAEFGISNLTIPKRLLKGKKGQAKPTASKPTEPPPPYPPPPPFIPLTAGKVGDQIGLLRPYYQNRFVALTATTGPPSASLSLPGPSLPPPPTSQFNMHPHAPPLTTIPSSDTQLQLVSSFASYPPPPPELILPDDQPNPAQMKITPIGQVVKANVGSGTSKKKKATGAEGPAAPVGPLPTVTNDAIPPTDPRASGPPGTDVASNSGSPKKKKGSSGVGTGNGRKKKPDGPPGSAGVGGYSSPVMPAVVFASA